MKQIVVTLANDLSDEELVSARRELTYMWAVKESPKFGFAPHRFESSRSILSLF